MRRIIHLFVLVVLMFLTLTGIFAQETLPSFTPPALAVVVVLDDTRTMLQQNSANASGRSVWGTGTDEDDTRADAIRMIAALLHADQTQEHQLAVYRFYNRNTGGWLTDEGDNFIRLGGTDSAVSQAAFNGLDADLRSRSIPRDQGGGDSHLALQAVNQVLNAKYTSGTIADKIIVLLITDDVPILDFGTSPWSGNGASWLAADGTNFLNQRTALNTLPNYDNPTCPTANDDPVFAVFPMGAANWVNADGSVPFTRDAQPTAENIGTFFTQYEQSSLLLAGTPLVYPIVPQFGDAETMRQAFRDAVGRLLAETRCVRRTSITLDTSNVLATGEFEMSNLYPTVRLIVQGRSDAEVRVRDANNAPITESDTSGVRVADNGDGVNVWSFSRDAFTGAWEGDWQVSVSGGNASVFIEREINPSEIAWQAVDEQPAYPGNSQISYQVNLLADGTHTIRESDSFSLILRLNDTSSGTAQDFQLTPTTGDGYTVIIPEGAIQAKNYSVQIMIRFNQAWGSTIEAGHDYVINSPSGRIIIDSPPEMIVVQPGADSVWCQGGTQLFRVTLNWRSEIRAIADPASLYSYAQVYLIYDPPAPLDIMTPVPATLIPLRANLGDPLNPEDDVFEVVLNCDTDLLRGEQNISVVGRLGDQVTFEHTRVGQYTSPTPSHTPPATAIYTAIPSLTPSFTPRPALAVPTQPPVSLVEGVIRPVTEPPLRDILLILAVFGLIIGTYIGIGRYRENFLPLSFVSMEREPDVTRRPMLSGWRALLPFTQRRSVYEDEAGILFTIERDDQGDFVYAPQDEINVIGDGDVEIVSYGTKTEVFAADTKSNNQAIAAQNNNALREPNDATYDYRVASYPILGKMLYTVQRIDENGNPYNRAEARKRFIPRANRHVVTDPSQRSLRLFTITWSGYERSIQITADQTLNLDNDREVEQGKTEPISLPETVIRVNNLVFHVYNRRSRSEI